MFDVIIDIFAWILIRVIVVGVALLIVALIILMIGEAKNWWE